MIGLNVLFSHTNYPSQFRRLVPLLASQGHDIYFIAKSKEWHAPQADSFELIKYKSHRTSASAWLHPYLRRFEDAVLEGQAAYRSALKLKQRGWKPDVIVHHAGFGNGFYLSDAFPEARKIGLFEWYYNEKGSDVDFFDLQKNYQSDPDRGPRVRTLNASLLLDFASCDAAVVPTVWQRQQFPAHLRDHLHVIHEGVDVDHLSQLRERRPPRPSCLPCGKEVEVVTYVSRGFEEYRGFPQAMQAIAQLQRQRPNLHALLVGSDVVAYGRARPDGQGWQGWAQQESGLDPARTHWLGSLQMSDYHAVLAWSDVHLYLTIPFVLSWSLLEAMAAGCAVVASATQPVQEVMANEQQGLLVDFFDVPQISSSLGRLLDDRQLNSSLGQRAQERARCYDHKRGSQAWNQVLFADADRGGQT